MCIRDSLKYQRLSEGHEGRQLIKGDRGIRSGHQVERIVWPDEAFIDGRFRLALIGGKANSNRLVVDEVSVHSPTDEFGMPQQSRTLLPGDAVQLAPDD